MYLHWIDAQGSNISTSRAHIGNKDRAFGIIVTPLLVFLMIYSRNVVSIVSFKGPHPKTYSSSLSISCFFLTISSMLTNLKIVIDIFIMSTFTPERSREEKSMEDDERVDLLPNDIPKGQRNGSLRSHLKYWSCVIARLCFVISYAVLVLVYLNQRGEKTCLIGQETIYDDPPVKYETVTFQQAGFHDTAHNHRTVYEGRPDAENNKAWEKLMSGRIQPWISSTSSI